MNRVFALSSTKRTFVKRAVGFALSFAILVPLAVAGTASAAPGPVITQVVASDPDNTDAVFGNGDVLRIYFSAATNRPGAPVLDTNALNELFAFSNSIGAAYEGTWVAPHLLVVRILDAAGATPAVGSLTVGIAGTILSANGSSAPSEGVSPVLSGNWGTASEAGARAAALSVDILPPSGFPALPTLVAQGASVFFEVEVRNRSAEPASGVVCLDADPAELRVVALAGLTPANPSNNRVCVKTKVLASRETQTFTATTSAIAPECTRAEARVVVRTVGSTPATDSVAFAVAQGGGRSVVGPSSVPQGEGFTLSASAAGCYPDATQAAAVGYAWSCTAGASGQCINQNSSGVLVLPNAPQVDIPAGALAAGQVYTFRVMIAEPARAPLEGVLAVTVNRPPSGGFCTVAPPASAPEDEVLLECAGWGDSEGDLPLGYRFGVVREGETIWLSGFLAAPVLSTKLPALATAVVATIEDSRGARAEYVAPVSVGATTFGDSLAPLVAPQLRRVEDLALMGDATGFLAAAHSIAGMLHVATDAVSTFEDRVAVRKRLAALFVSLARESKDTGSGAGSLEASLHLLAEIARRPNELEPETVEIISAAVETLLLDGRTAVSDAGGDGMDAAFATLIVAESLIDAIAARESDPTLDPESLAKLRRARVASNVRMIEAGRALLKGGVSFAGDSPVQVAGALAAFDFSRAFLAEIVGSGSAVEFDHALGSVSLPGSLFDALPTCPTSGAAQNAGGSVASCTPAIIDVDFAVFESNPYTYSGSELVSPVLSAVVSTPDGLEISVSGLGEPVSFVLAHSAGPGASTSNVRCVYFDRSENVWSEQGCTTIAADSSTIECSCSHLSAFGAQSTVVAPQAVEQQKCFFKMQVMAGKVAKLHKKAHSKCLKLAKKGKISDAEECAQNSLAAGFAKAGQKTIDSQLKHCAILPDFAHSSADAINAAAYGETGQLFAEVLGTNGQGHVRSSSSNITTASCLQKVAISLDKVSGYRRKMVAKRIKSGMNDGMVLSSADAQRLYALPDGVIIPFESEDDAKLAAKVAKAEAKVLKTLEKKCLGVDLAETFPGVCAGATSAQTFSDCANEIARCHTCREGRETLTMFADCDLLDNTLRDGSCQ